MDSIPILNALTGKAARGGCVKYVYDGLSHEFRIEIKRDLSYPTVEPQQFSLEDIANFPLETVGTNP